ncbi:MAG: glycosyltransferase family 4 protein [Thermodesulfovibrionales bacterium]
MRVLVLNRRDIRNPAGGGAEVYTHEVAKGLAARGCEVTGFSSRFAGSLPEETVDGVRYLRAGNELTVHVLGFLYARRHREEFDLVIDEFNGLGFFGFLLPRSVLLIHQLYRGFWFRELGPLLGAAPYVLEPLVLRLYRKRPAVAVSESTRGDLKALGFKDVRVVMNALTNEALDDVPEKEARPTLLFLGRLRSTKKPEDALEIFRLLKEEVPEARLWVAGSGPDEEKLRRKAAGMEGVAFLGRVSEERKFQALRRAHVLVVPGVREGFGINVIEAASQGTPAVGYDIHGLRDSIRDGETGLLASGPEDAARKAAALLKDRALYGRLAANCLRYARGFRWEERAGEFWRAVEEFVPPQAPPLRGAPPKNV